ncbi:MAG: aminotransferase class V-fold PLP-dependent enzyme [Planctomycetaceae bacterium]
MRPLLYLDTARLGQTLPAARDAQIDFVRLTAEEPSTLYFEEFLKHGYNAWPDYYQNRFPALRTWAGVRALKQSLRQLAGAPDDWNVLLASRSLSLVQLAARSMFQVCLNVLTTDLSWPTYQDAVTKQALGSGGHVTTVPLRDAVFHEGWTADDVASFLARAYADNQCDGLFLPAVDHLGIRVPIRAIVERIRQTSEVQFVLVDAAQAFCHVPIDESVAVADFVVTGCHKWMRAGQPMGIGLFGQHQSRPLITDTLHKLSNTGSDLDPLLQFTEQIAGSVLNGHSETVNLSPLFSCSAAADFHLENNAVNEAARKDHWESHIHRIPDSLNHWVPVLTHRTLRSRISLFATTEPKIRTNPVEHARREWLNHGCVVTAYDNGLVRVSPPISSPAAITENCHIADDQVVAGTVQRFSQ